MSTSAQLSRQRLGTVLNRTSIQQERQASKACNIALHHFNKDVIKLDDNLSITFKKTLTNEYAYQTIYGEKSNNVRMVQTYTKPDGGIFFLNYRDGDVLYTNPLLSYECKKQGTNKKRMKQGLKKQAKGNAIERAFKNVCFFKKTFKHVKANFYLVFGYGDDFITGSSINYRTIPLHNFKMPFDKKFSLANPAFNKNSKVCNHDCDASVYLKEEEWTVNEMAETMYFTMFSMYAHYCHIYSIVPNFKRGSLWKCK